MKNLNIHTLSEGFAAFAEPSVFNRFFKHEELQRFIRQLPDQFKISTAGYSVENRDIQLITWGKGPVKIFLWSQMHGDEATGTMALLDLINFLQQQQYARETAELQTQCTLYLLPMVNPDGAARFTRRNAQQIDINRDFLKTASPEAKLLKTLREQLQPDFGFNLHDQNTLWSVSDSNKPATLSFLAPAFDQNLSLSSTRKNAMLVIGEMFNQLSYFLPGQIGRFDDAYEPRAFGDNFQLAGTATILIEAGGFVNDDEKQEIRKYYFLSILTGLKAIATKDFENQNISNYLSIPENDKLIFHILIHQVKLNGIPVSIGLNYDEKPDISISNTSKTYVVADIGDLDILSAYHVYDAPSLEIEGQVLFDENADFHLLSEGKRILSFKNGLLESKL